MIKTNSNMSQKSNSRSTTLLGAETLIGSAEEAVCRLTQNPQQR